MGFNVKDTQYTSTGDVTGFISSGSLSGSKEAVFAGASGSTAYTVGDIVSALKDVGVLAVD